MNGVERKILAELAIYFSVLLGILTIAASVGFGIPCAILMVASGILFWALDSDLRKNGGRGLP